MLLTPFAIAVLNIINLAIRAPSYYVKIRDTRNCFTPTPADKQQICEHVIYGEMVESVYDTLIFDDKSISNLKCILGKDGINEFISATFPGYEVQTLLATCSTTFLGKKDPPAYMGFVAFNKAKRDLAVIFRGTKTLKETFEDAKQIGDYWDVPSKLSGDLNDLDFIKGFWLSWFGDSSERIVLHRGFKLLYCTDEDAESGNPDRLKGSPQERILKCVRDCLQSNPSSIDTITISGHSLGASLAEIAALDVAQNLEKLGKNEKVKTRLVTFACPRTGSAAMGKEFNRLKVNHYHYLNRGDIVPIMSAPAFVHYNDEYYHERRYDPVDFRVVALQYFADLKRPLLLNVVLDFWGIFAWHNLEHILYNVATSAGIKRDPGLINKSDKCLNKEDPRFTAVPESWWSVRLNKGVRVVDGVLRERFDDDLTAPELKTFIYYYKMLHGKS